MKKALVIVVALFALPSFAAIDALAFQHQAEEETYHKLTEELRCPQCQNNNIADSNSLIAQDMRKKVFQLLQEGKTEKEVVDYMVARYGDFVTYDPPLKISTLILWLAPLFVLLLACIRLFSPAKKIGKKVPFSEEGLSLKETERLQALLQEEKH